jgi:transcriptional regulator GlxA family with amidase domain
MRDHNQLTSAEQQAVILVRELRRQIVAGSVTVELMVPARLAHHLITLYHGHAQLRMSRIAPELGVTMRTLQRSFRKTFHTTMRNYQINTRLKFAQYLLSVTLGIKMSVIARQLGYDDPNVFERFFRQHIGTSPHAWSKAEQALHPQRFQQR